VRIIETMSSPYDCIREMSTYWIGAAKPNSELPGV
jgi:hypothetical protein